jgi:hypothetical protein
MQPSTANSKKKAFGARSSRLAGARSRAQVANEAAQVPSGNSWLQQGSRVLKGQLFGAAALRQRITNPVFKVVLDDVYERVRAGSALSEAFEAHAGLFPGVYTASLLAGEKSGNLEQVLRRYVSYVKVVSGVRRKTVSALVYPAILVALSLVVVTVIVVKVVPEFGNFYNQFGKELPLSTRFIVGLSTFVTSLARLIVPVSPGWSRRHVVCAATRPDGRSIV